ncbi:MAG: outer membrane homotrimeric porin [Desulfovibrio sp.]|nr:outer membrane homotrimeric porin [Desulfovibrio sp.]
MSKKTKRVARGRALALASSCLALGLACPPAEVQAVDFKAKGVWISMLEMGDGGNFMRKDRTGRHQQGWGRWGEDRFEAKNRVRLQLEAVASESLSGTVYFEMGTFTWGKAKTGGALGADGKIIKIKHSYLDWKVPDTDVKVRMGLQRIFLPDYATEASQVFDADVAGISVSAPFNENAALTAFWARPFNDNWEGGERGCVSYLDNADFFGLSLALNFDGFKLTPWVMGGMIGKNTFRTWDEKNNRYWYYGKDVDSGGGWGFGLAPAAYADRGRDRSNAYAGAIWAGLTGEFTGCDPFRLAWSFNYGSIATGEEALDRRGFYAALLAEYKFDWGTPGIYGWYSSGDDDDPTNGSERLPSIGGNNESTSGLTSIATMATWTLGRDGVLGQTLSGTWGVGLRVRDVSFVENLKHTLHVNYYQGTNSSDMARYIKGAASPYKIVTPNTSAPDFNTVDYGLYLTDKDRAFEVGLMSTWQIYDNLRLLVEANYIALWLDNSRSVWGGFTKGGAYRHANSTEDLWNVNVSLIYKF